MADTDYASLIRTESNAKTMREEIADGIEQAQNDASNAVNTANNASNTANTANDRVNNIITTQNGQTPVEVIDAHHSNVTGQTSDNIGARMDGFDTSLAEKTQQILNSFQQSLTNKIGINIHNSGHTNLTTNFDKIVEAGFKYVRDDIYWTDVETIQGQYIFVRSGLDIDAYINTLISKGLIPYLVLHGFNPIYCTDNSAVSESEQTAFTNFAIACATRYANKNIIWEVHNEPNNAVFWSPQTSATPNDYTSLVKQVAMAIKNVDKSAKVFAPALSYGTTLYGWDTYNWLEQTFKNGLLEYIDGISVHPYRTMSPETVITDIFNARTLIKKYTNRDIELISGEWGYSTVSNWNSEGANYIVDETTQAQYLTRMLLINDYLNIPLSIIYDWKDDGTDNTNVEDWFGIVQNDGITAKPSYTSLQTLFNTLNGYTFVERIDIGKQDDYLLRYINNSNQQNIYVFWTIDSLHTFILNESILNGTLITMNGTQSSINGNNLILNISGSPTYLILNSTQPGSLTTKNTTETLINQVKNDLMLFCHQQGLEKAIGFLANTDLNTITANGFYRINNNCINMPISPMWGSLIVTGNSPNREMTQIVIASNVTDGFYYRTGVLDGSNNLIWNSWIQILSATTIKSFGSWQFPALSNGSNISLQNLRYCKDITKTVFLAGAINPEIATGVCNLLITSLPIGFRPHDNENFSVDGGRVQVSTDGQVTLLRCDSSTFVAFSGISFKSDN